MIVPSRTFRRCPSSSSPSVTRPPPSLNVIVNTICAPLAGSSKARSTKSSNVNSSLSTSRCRPLMIIENVLSSLTAVTLSSAETSPPFHHQRFSCLILARPQRSAESAAPPVSTRGRVRAPQDQASVSEFVVCPAAPAGAEAASEVHMYPTISPRRTTHCVFSNTNNNR